MNGSFPAHPEHATCTRLDADERALHLPGQLRIAKNAYLQDVLKAAHGMLEEQHGLLQATLRMETACLDEPDADAIEGER